MSGEKSRTSAGLIKLGLTLYPEQLDQLERLSKAGHVSKSVIVRQVLDREFDRLEKSAPVLAEAVA